ncbi:hypothetical protein [Croceiramulus getboli]|nr:hypothetical protein P8624_00280 [Flavobacteriaceae bacterium YJPT1-3]
MINYQVKLEQIKTVDEFPQHWSSDDYRNVLTQLDVDDIQGIDDGDLREYLFMALTDLEPQGAAFEVLHYRLKEQLSEGQLKQIAHDMLEDRIAEEYADISLHDVLYDCNQLLFKAFRGQFPNIKATQIRCSLMPMSKNAPALSPEIILKALDQGLTSNNIINRLFEDQLAGKIPFPEAEHVIWEWRSVREHEVEFTTSDYWLSKEDFTQSEFVGQVHLLES